VDGCIDKELKNGLERRKFAGGGLQRKSRMNSREGNAGKDWRGEEFAGGGTFSFSEQNSCKSNFIQTGPSKEPKSAAIENAAQVMNPDRFMRKHLM